MPSNDQTRINLIPSAYLTYAELNRGQPCSVDQFRNHLSRFARNDLLLFCCYASAVLFGPDLGWNWDFHSLIVKTYLPPSLAEVRNRDGEPRPVLHRQLLLYLAKEAAVICPLNGLSALRGRSTELATLILMANDLLGFPSAQKIPDENNLGFLAVIVASAEGSRFSAWRHKMVRTALIIEHVLECERELAAKFDVFELFEKAGGIPLRTYISLIFSLAGNRLNAESTINAITKSTSIGANYFRDTLLSRAQATSFFADIGVGINAPINISGAPGVFQVSDFRAFADKPLLQIESNFYPIDFDLLVAKADTGVFWKILNYFSSKKEREAFITFWGEVFEFYVNWVISHFATNIAANQFLRDPRFEDNPTDQCCDAIGVSGTTACFLEYKGAVFTSEAKYSGDPVKLKAEIEDKLIGTEQRRKGLRQLARAIENARSVARKIRHRPVKDK